MLKFKKIEIDDIDIYRSFTDNAEELSCEHSFVNLLVWQSAYNNMMAVEDGQLILKSCDDNLETFSLPFGDDFDKGIALIQEYCGNKKADFWVQEGALLEKFKSRFENDYIFNEKRDDFDYIYNTADLAELKGKKYHSKRNHISAFSKKYNWHYEKITPKNIEDIKECAEKWYNENAFRYDDLIECEKLGIKTMLNNMERLNLNGGAIYVDGEVVAFTLGSAINSKIFNIHIEKALNDYAGAYTVINNEFVKNELLNYKYINREDDLGLEGLRKAKLSYKPVKLLKKYYCQPVKNDE